MLSLINQDVTNVDAMSESARNLVSAILSNEDIINTLANACTGQNTGNRIQYRSPDEEIYSLFHRGRPNAGNLPGQAGPVFQTNTPSTSQVPPTTAPIYNLRPSTRKSPGHRR